VRGRLFTGKKTFYESRRYGYLMRLIEAGYRVAKCEPVGQDEVPATAHVQKVVLGGGLVGERGVR
jgi:hypothetical protein